MTSPTLQDVGPAGATFLGLKSLQSHRVMGDHRRQKPTKEAIGAGIPDMTLQPGTIPKIAKAIRADRGGIQKGDGVGDKVGETEVTRKSRLGTK
eukprot:6643139-Prorocentrum_lima.AAC.1